MTLSNCTICPRKCKVNRLNKQLGFCNSLDKIKVARSALHFWEEPCISGKNGSGTIFFSNCNLKCVFCQNYKISTGGFGKEISTYQLSELFLNLQNQGANNINLVTPTHYAPQIIESIKLAKSKGLTLPILYNSNGYESLETLKMLKGFIDVYLPDLKYFDNKYSVKYSNCDNYFKIATSAIEEMFNQVGKPQFNKDGIITKGLIIRHLMLPGLLFDTKKVIDYIYATFKDNVFISLMNQYTPTNNLEKFPEINKTLNPKHYDSMISYCLDLGIKNAFIQDFGTCSESFIPSFDLNGVDV